MPNLKRQELDVHSNFFFTIIGYQTPRNIAFIFLKQMYIWTAVPENKHQDHLVLNITL